MAEPVPLLKALETLLVGALQPLVDAAGDDRVRQIEILPLSGMETLAEILRDHRSRLPGAWLSVPSVTFAPNQPRLTTLTLSYAFLIGTGGRARPSDNVGLAYSFFEQACRQLAGINLNHPANGVAAHLDFVRPTSWDFATVENQGPPVSASFLTFDLGVRNWLIN